MYKVIAGVCVVAAVSAVAWSRHEEQVKHESIWYENETVLVELREEVKQAQFRLKKVDKGIDPALIEEVKADRDEMRKAIAALTLLKKDLSDYLEAREGELAQFEKDSLQSVRSRALGKQWKEFKTKEGRIYRDATVVAVDDSGVNLRHVDGSARVHFKDLTDEQRTSFGLDAISAALADAQEKEDAQAYEAAHKAAVARQAALNAAAAAGEPVTNGPGVPYVSDYVPSHRRIEASKSANGSKLSEPPRLLGTKARRSGRYYYISPSEELYGTSGQSAGDRNAPGR